MQYDKSNIPPALLHIHLSTRVSPRPPSPKITIIKKIVTFSRLESGSKKKTSLFCCQGQKWFFEIFTVIICTVHNAYRVRVILMRLSRMNASFEVTCKLLLKLKSSICTIFCYKILHWTAFSWNDCAITNSGWVDTVKTLQNDNLCKSQLAFHKFQTFWIFTKL